MTTQESTKTASDDVIVTIRLPRDLHAALKAQARNEERSFGAHVRWIASAHLSEKAA